MCIFVYVCMYVCMCLCLCVCMYVCVCVCMCVGERYVCRCLTERGMIFQPVDLASFLKFRLWQSNSMLAEHILSSCTIVYSTYRCIYIS